MRRRKIKSHVSLKTLLVIVSFLVFVSLGYSYLSLTLKINGRVSGQMSDQGYTIAPDSNPNLKTQITKSGEWQENGQYMYDYDAIITNIGTTVVDNFKMTIEFINTINNVTISGYNSSVNNRTLVITNSNYILNSNQSVTIEFIVSSSVSNLKINTIKQEVMTGTNEVTLDKFNVIFSIANGWGAYTYQYNVTLTNKTGSTINAWELNVTLPTGTTYDSGWSAIYSFNNGIINIKNEQYNGNLANNASLTIGLQLTTNIANFIPTNIKASVR